MYRICLDCRENSKIENLNENTCPYCNSNRVGIVKADPSFKRRFVIMTIAGFFLIVFVYGLFKESGATITAVLVILLIWVSIKNREDFEKEQYEKARQWYEQTIESQKSFWSPYKGEYIVLSYEEHVTVSNCPRKIIAEKKGISYTFDNKLLVEIEDDVRHVQGALLCIDEMGCGVIKAAKE